MSDIELAERLSKLSHAVGGLLTVATAMEQEVPLYSVPSLSLAIASLGELVTTRALQVHALAHQGRDDAHEAAGWPSPDVVRYVRTLITEGREPGREAGRWS